MLDLIEYLAQWVRGAAADPLPGARRAARAPPELGRRPARRHVGLPRPADPRRDRELVTVAAARRRTPRRRGGRRRSPSARAATRCSPRRWSRLLLDEESRRRGASCPTPCRRCSPRGSTRSSRSSAGSCSRPRSSAGRSGRASLAPWPPRRAATCDEALASLRGEGHRRARARRAGLAGEREFAFKHVLIRDVAYGMLPKAVRARKHFEVGGFIEERAGDRTDEVVALLAEHYGRAAALAGEARPRPPSELEPIQAQGAAASSRRPATPPRRCTRTARRSRTTRPRASSRRRHDGARPRADRREAGRRRAAARAASTRRSRCGRSASTTTAAQEDLERVADLHRKIGAGLWHKGERKQAIEHYQKGINLLKDGPPRLELVRLYEEAAWLYMHTGDNMLAIYASEKALRLAERLGETRAASRAHGIFGRVFGRIGDTAKARENLERSVELARGSGPRRDDPRAAGARPPPRDLRGRLRRRRRGLRRGAGARRAASATCPRRSSCTPRSPSSPSTAPTGTSVERATEASAELAEREGLVGKLCLPYALRGLLRWRDGDWDGAERLFRRAHELAEQVGWSEVAFSALFGLAIVLRDRGDALGATTALAQALDVCERAGLIAQSIQAISARAVIAGAGRQGRAGARGGRGGRRRWPSACTTRSAARPRSRPTARPPRRARHSSCCARRASSGPPSAARSTRRAAPCSRARAARDWTPRPPPRRSRRHGRSTSGPECATRHSAPAISPRLRALGSLKVPPAWTDTSRMGIAVPPRTCTRWLGVGRSTDPDSRTAGAQAAAAALRARRPAAPARLQLEPLSAPGAAGGHRRALGRRAA